MRKPRIPITKLSNNRGPTTALLSSSKHCTSSRPQSSSRSLRRLQSLKLGANVDASHQHALEPGPPGQEFHQQVTNLVGTTFKLLGSRNLICGKVSGFMRDDNRVMDHRYASVRTLRCPGSTGGLRTSVATRAAMLRTPSSKSVALGGTVINLDAPHYISLVMIRVKYNEGRLKDSTAHGYRSC